MENYPYNSSYPDSGDSSPRSREIDFDSIQTQNPNPWADDNYKAKFMCSYGGKIHPRPHDNQLSYIGGDTKILAVDRSTRFSTFLSKLSSLCGSPENDCSTLSFKYQLPGEDLDALISVTSDDDLEHMMHEYDRLFRSSPKPARMRLFLFFNSNNINTSNSNPHSSYGSDGGKSDRDRFVDALNSSPPIPEVPPPSVKSPPPPPSAAVQNNVDFLFGLEKGIPVPHQNLAAPPPPPVAATAPQVVRVPEFPLECQEDRVVGSDLAGIHAQFQRLQVREQFEQHVRVPGYPAGKNSDDNLIGSYAAVGGGGGGGGGEYYVQRPAASVPVSVPQAVAAAYWPEKQMAGGGTGGGGGFHAPLAATQEQQPVYVMTAPGGGMLYHASPVMRPVTGQTGQGYYPQRVGGVAGAGGPHEVYREQQVYGMVPQTQQLIPTSTQQQQQLPCPPTAGGPTATSAYAQVAYDSALGRQVYYNAHAAQQPAPIPQTSGGGVVYQGVEGKVVVSKASQGSV